MTRFRLALAGETGKNRRTAGRFPSFVEALEAITLRLYVEVLQGIHPWTPSAPEVERSRPAAEDDGTLTSELIEQLPRDVPDEPPLAVEGAWWLNNSPGVSPSKVTNAELDGAHPVEQESGLTEVGTPDEAAVTASPNAGDAEPSPPA